MSGKLTVLASLIAALAGISSAADSDAPKDSTRSAAPADTFSFVYEEGWGTKLDTYSGTITKDLVLDRDVTVPLKLAQSDIDSVYRKMIEIGFFDIPEPHPPYPTGCSMNPRTTIHLEATLFSKTKRLFWSTGPCGKGPAEWGRLGQLQALIWRIIERQPKYRELPRHRGGYM